MSSRRQPDVGVETAAAVDLDRRESWVLLTTNAPVTLLDVDGARTLARMLTTTAEEAEALLAEISNAPHTTHREEGQKS